MNDQQWRAHVHESIDQSLAHIQKNPFLAQQIQKKMAEKKKDGRKIAALPLLAAAMMLLLLAGAWAMDLPLWGLKNWLAGEDRPPLPIATSQPHTLGETSHPLGEMRVREMTTDGYGIYFSLEFIPKNEKTLLLSSPSFPGDSVRSIGISPDFEGQTIAQWADAHGYPDLYSLLLYDADVYTSGQSTYSPLYAGLSYPELEKIEENGIHLFMMSLPWEENRKSITLSYLIRKIEEQPADVNEKMTTMLTSVEADGNHKEYFLSIPLEPAENMGKTIIAQYAPLSHGLPENHELQLESLTLFQTPVSGYWDMAYTLSPSRAHDGNREGSPWLYLSGIFGYNTNMHIWQQEEKEDGSIRYHLICSCVLPDSLPEILKGEISLRDPTEDPDDDAFPSSHPVEWQRIRP